MENRDKTPRSPRNDGGDANSPNRKLIMGGIFLVILSLVTSNLRMIFSTSSIVALSSYEGDDEAINFEPIVVPVESKPQDDADPPSTDNDPAASDSDVLISDGLHIDPLGLEKVSGDLQIPLDPPDDPIFFEPGSLGLTKVETYRHCHVPKNEYWRNMQRAENKESGRYAALISNEHRLIYQLIGKSASSSNRWIMSNAFNATDGAWPKLPADQYHKFTFTREPMDRFFSSFQEAMYRLRPWVGAKKDMDRADVPFAYLFENLSSDNDWYNKSLCDDDCFRSRFERFVTEHDPLVPADTHLSLQVALPYHVNKYDNGTKVGPKPYELDAVYDTADLDQVWSVISASRNVTLPEDSSSAKRKGEKLFDPKTSSDETKQRICNMLAIEYCCFNYQLPDVCQGIGIQCMMHKVDDTTKISPAKAPVKGGFSKFQNKPAEASPQGGLPTISDGERQLFEPGSLNVSRIEAFRHCHVPKDVYGKQYQSTTNIDGKRYTALVSNQYRLAYYLIGKSASSSNRWIMTNVFNSTEKAWPELPLDQYEHFTFTREPLDRFFSSFQETVFRLRPWGPEMKNRKSPYPYLTEGLSSDNDWDNKTLCDDDCYRERFERFVTEHDPLNPPDVHIKLQAGMLFRYTEYANKTTIGPTLPPISAVYDTLELDEVWERFATSKGVSLPRQSSTPKRKMKKLFDPESASDEAKKRICHMVAIDYCCFNYRLPFVCQNVGVQCAMENVNGRIRIGPEKPPVPGGYTPDTNPVPEGVSSSVDSEIPLLERALIDIPGLDPPQRRTLPAMEEGETVEFEPGSLNLTRVETFRHCHVPVQPFWRNYQRTENKENGRYASLISNEHHLMYHLIGKSASSSNRWIMVNGFQATDGGWPKLPSDQYFRFTFTREPLDRFYSSFQEAIYRMRPFTKAFKDIDRASLPNAYLYENLVSDNDWYNKTLCDDDCYRSRFERFVTEHDPLKPVDTHLSLQAAMLYHNDIYANGTKLHAITYELDAVFDTKELDFVWEKIASSRNVILPKDSSTPKRKGPKLFDYATSSNETKQRICRMTAIDYCCYNYELPEVCQDIGIKCKMSNIGGETKIEPLHPPMKGGILSTDDAAAF